MLQQLVVMSNPLLVSDLCPRGSLCLCCCRIREKKWVGFLWLELFPVTFSRLRVNPQLKIYYQCLKRKPVNKLLKHDKCGNRLELRDPTNELRWKANVAYIWPEPRIVAKEKRPFEGVWKSVTKPATCLPSWSWKYH